MATVESSGTARPDGTLAPLVKDKLVYASTWEDFPCTRLGGQFPGQKSDQSTGHCQAVTLFDASTGEMLFSWRTSLP